MKIAIVGGGASGVAASIFIKRDHPDYDVCIFESNDKLFSSLSFIDCSCAFLAAVLAALSTI